jgi:hypothetical protein
MGSAVLGVNWYSSFDRPDAQGIVQIKPRAYVEGGHSFLMRGADTKKALAACCNSWSDSWGVSGNFYLPFRDLERLLHEDGECCAAIQKSLKAAVAL